MILDLQTWTLIVSLVHEFFKLLFYLLMHMMQ